MAAARTRSLSQPQSNIDMVNDGRVCDLLLSFPPSSSSLMRVDMIEASNIHRLKLDRMRCSIDWRCVFNGKDAGGKDEAEADGTAGAKGGPTNACEEAAAAAVGEVNTSLPYIVQTICNDGATFFFIASPACSACRSAFSALGFSLWDAFNTSVYNIANSDILCSNRSSSPSSYSTSGEEDELTTDDEAPTAAAVMTGSKLIGATSTSMIHTIRSIILTASEIIPLQPGHGNPGVSNAHTSPSWMGPRNNSKQVVGAVRGICGGNPARDK